MIVVDAMNVIGSVPDGWWKDRDDALRRLVEAVAEHDFGEWVVVVADGRPVDRVPAGTRGDVELRYAGRSDRDAADDDIVALVDQLHDDEPVTVVTSDRGLTDRLPPSVRSAGALTFRRRVGW